MERSSELGRCGRKEPSNHIGIDIHKKHGVLSALNEAGERTLEAKIATNDREWFERRYEAIPPRRNKMTAKDAKGFKAHCASRSS